MAQATRVVRRPISLKIFGIALALLVMMALVTVMSSVHLRRLGDQLDFLSRYYIQLDQITGEVRANGLGEIILMERILQNRPKVSLAAAREAATQRHKAAGECDTDATRAATAELRKAYPAAADYQIVVYEFIKLCANARVEKAARLLAEARALPMVRGDPEQVEALTRMREDLDDVPAARARLHGAFERYLEESGKAQKGAGDRVLAVLRGQIDEHRSAVARQITNIGNAIHTATRESAARAIAMKDRVLWLSWAIMLAAFAVGILFAAFITRSLVRPVHDLLTGTQEVENGNLNIEIRLQSADEIAQLGDSFNHMVKELRQKEAIKEMFGKYVDPRVVQTLLDRQDLGEGERRVMTVFFSDLQGSTVLGERMTPTALVKLLNRYFSMMAEAIRAHQGIIDKYIGDSIMAFWGPPFSTDTEHAALACFAALEQQARMAKFQAMVPELMGVRRDAPQVRMRMGLAAGDVTVGSIGSNESRSYTVIGDTVNLASRLESANKQYKTQIMLNEEVRTLAGEAIEAREIDAVRVAGKSESVRIFELLGRKGAITPQTAELRDQYEKALQRYRGRDWNGAQAGFEACLKIVPDDGPAAVFLERVRRLREQPPQADWTGTWNFAEK